MLGQDAIVLVHRRVSEGLNQERGGGVEQGQTTWDVLEGRLAGDEQY